MSRINIYTDGSSRGNPGPGGYGVILQYKDYIKELSAGFKLTTNNRMELLAVIVGLESIKQKGHKIIVFSDSQYVVNAVNKGWVFDWEKNHYKKKKNSDLWRRFIKVYRKHVITFNWVKGHSGDPKNERCDQLAVIAATGNELLLDKGYELANKNNKGLFD
jgi:ribonuclease HI